MLDPVASLASLLSVAAQRNPGGPAIRDQGTTTTWTEAVARSGRMATAIRQAGVQPGDRVGVHYRKSADSFLAMHAVVQQGAIAVPLDPTASGNYLASVIEQTSCRVILSHPPCQATIQELTAKASFDAILGLPRPSLKSDQTIPETETPDRPNPVRFVDQSTIDELDPTEAIEVDPDQPAYIITTSGSTGQPKGICHSHNSALAYVRFKEAAYDFGPNDRISDIAPNHFDISTLALWVTPFIGATNVVVPEPYQMFPASLATLIAEEQISVWYSVPYLLTQLLDRGGLDALDLTSMRWILFGGEVFPTQALRNLMTLLPKARFSNVYGPAEVNACTVHHLPGFPDIGSPVPIGKPVNDTKVRIVDEDQNPTTDKGEIWVQSSTMMLEYWGQPDLTRKSVWRDPATDESWYRTGDLGWLDQNDDLVFAGRVDHQVKVRGHRVELEAIESVLEDADEIGNAVATIARTDDGSDVVICGFRLRPDSTLNATELRLHCANRLPTYAVPAFFYPISPNQEDDNTAANTSPMTGSGKLDRRALRADLLQLHTTSQKNQAID